MARKATKKTITLSRKNSRVVEEKHIGQETTDWKDVKNMERAVYDCLRHYGYFYDAKDSANWAKTWVKANKSDAQYKNFCAAEDWYIPRTLGSLCKMMLNGAKFKKDRMDWITAHVNEVIARGKDNIKHKNVVALPTRRSPAEIVKERTSDFIGEIEGFIDDFMLGRMTKEEIKEWSAYEEMKRADVPYITAKSLHDYYIPLRNELDELLKGKSRDLLEAYQNMTVRERKAFRAIVHSIIEDANMYMVGKKAVRKPRAKKVKTAGAQVAHVKYKKEDKEFKLTSLTPDAIVGATELYLFNTKYRAMTYLKASKKTGFTVRGTTVQDVDLDSSYKKTIRKPAEFLGLTAKTTKTRVRKLLKELKTKQAAANGRIGEDTIIFKAY